MPQNKENPNNVELDSDSIQAIHNAIQESYEVGASDATLNDAGNDGGTQGPEAFEEEADHGISRMMGEGGVAPPETPQDWREWSKYRQPNEGDRYGKM